MFSCIYGLCNRFHCEYGPIDRTSEANKEVDKIFASALKSKLSTNQKKAKKRVEMQNKKADKDSMKQTALDARTVEKRNSTKTPLVPLLVVPVVSTASDSETSCPKSLTRQPLPIGQTKQRRASRLQAGLTSKRGCQCNFVAKQLYMDNTLCEVQYHEINHFNKAGQPCHGSSFAGFRHSLGARLSWRTREWIRSMLGQGFSPAQIMACHKKEVWECAIEKKPCTRDTFIMPDDVYNMCKKRATELWKKHPRDPLSIRMWKEENEDNVFHYHEFGNLDLNETTPPPDEEETPFCLAIQTPWQLEIMLRYGHKRQISMDATFGTNEPKVCYASYHNLH
jgi:hypothetical protein